MTLSIMRWELVLVLLLLCPVARAQQRGASQQHQADLPDVVESDEESSGATAAAALAQVLDVIGEADK